MIIILMENSKVIEEADEALEHSLMMAIPAPPQQPPPHLTIKETNRDVLKLISRLPSHKQAALLDQSQQPPTNEPNSQPQPQPNPAVPVARLPLIGKYNYTGQSYRFEKAERELEVSKPDVPVQCKTEQNIEKEDKIEKELSMRDEKDSVLAQQSLDRSDIKFPSHNYYIMFDRKANKGRTQPVERKGAISQGFAATTYLERKVNNLESEIRRMKNSSGTTFNRSHMDGKMRLDQLLDSILP